MDKELFKKIKKRINKLQVDLDYYTKPRLISGTFTPEAHTYYRSIPNRLDELKQIIKAYEHN